MQDYVKFSDLVGMTLTKVDVGSDEIYLESIDGRKFKMYHQQDCCENVGVEDVVGDVADLIGTPIVVAEVSSSDDPDASEVGEWTFYLLRTAKGDVTLRWYGSSNGYYSTSVDFEEVK